MIINFTLINNIPDWICLQFEQLIKLKEKLENTFALNILCEKYETYIIGDFNTYFMNRNDNFDIKEHWKIFENSELQIISSENTNFILYNNYVIKDKIPDNIKINIIEECEENQEDIGIDFKGSDDEDDNEDTIALQKQKEDFKKDFEENFSSI